MRKLLAVVLTIFLAITLVGCGSTNSDGPVKISLTLWDEVQAPVIQKNIDRFNEEYKGKIEASIELVPWANYWTKLDASLESGESADVLWINPYLAKYVDGNVLQPIDEFIKKDKIDLTQYASARVEAYHYKDHQWALPKGLDVVYVAYNKALFDKYHIEYPKEGWTWDDMRAIADEFLAAGMKTAKNEYPIVMELDNQPSWSQFVVQNGGNYLSPESDYTKVEIAVEASVDAINQVVDLMKNKQMAPYVVLSETKGTDLFVSGVGAILFVGSWKAKVLEASSLGVAGNIGLVQMPKMAVNNFSVLGGLGYAMSAQTKHPKQAWELIKFITSETSLKAEADAGIDFPANLVAQANYVSSFKNIDAQVISDATKTGIPPQVNGFNSMFNPIINDAMALIFSGKAIAKETLEKAARAAQDVINEIKGTKH